MEGCEIRGIQGTLKLTCVSADELVVATTRSPSGLDFISSYSSSTGVLTAAASRLIPFERFGRRIKINQKRL